MLMFTRRKLVSGLVVLGCVFLQGGALAAVPTVLTQQGRLLDKAGVGVDADINFVFAIYDTPTAGTALWSETQTITIDQGFFSARIGEKTAFPANLFDASKTLYLGVKVGDDAEMAPRQTITSVPFAIRAGEAERAAAGGTLDARLLALEAKAAATEQRSCEDRGGAWDNSTGCAPFMRATAANVAATERWNRCTAEFGSAYQVCNAFQAMALAQYFPIPKHKYYWLTSGGANPSVDVQDTATTLFRTNGANPVLTCPVGGHTIAMFHSWDANHVDGLQCMSNTTADVGVLCCRRRYD
jgi:hypothetical protein